MFLLLLLLLLFRCYYSCYFCICFCSFFAAVVTTIAVVVVFVVAVTASAAETVVASFASSSTAVVVAADTTVLVVVVVAATAETVVVASSASSSASSTAVVAVATTTVLVVVVVAAAAAAAAATAVDVDVVAVVTVVDASAACCYWQFRLFSSSYQIPLWICCVLVVGYVIGGAVLFCEWEGWRPLDSAYFCFITLTTIGFGDFVPKADQRVDKVMCSMFKENDANFPFLPPPLALHCAGGRHRPVLAVPPLRHVSPGDDLQPCAAAGGRRGQEDGARRGDHQEGRGRGSAFRFRVKFTIHI